MRSLVVGLMITLLRVSSAAVAQQTVSPLNDTHGVSKADLAFGYNYIDSNAPPGGCHCFSMNGGFVSGDVSVTNWLSFVGEVTGNHASHISSLGQNLTLTTFLGGPRASLHLRRVTPFGEALFGAVRGTGSYFPTATSSTSSASSFGFSTGGGMDIALSRHFDLRALNVKYLRSSLPNGVEDTQNEFQISTGIVFRFKVSDELRPVPPPPPAPHPVAEISLNCGATEPQVTAGDAVQIVGQTMTLPDRLDVNYSWNTNAGAVQGDGRMITIDTTGLRPGTYRVDGRATLVSDPNVGATCQATFRVKHVKQTVVATAAVPAEIIVPQTHQDEFADHVHDIFFDYNKSRIRRDAREALTSNAAYLIAHPDISFTIAGYADERGTDAYNVSLGLKRAYATRDALAALGVDSSRIEVLSYGKAKPFCSDDTDACYQSNRRAQFVHDK